MIVFDEKNIFALSFKAVAFVVAFDIMSPNRICEKRYASSYFLGIIIITTYRTVYVTTPASLDS